MDLKETLDWRYAVKKYSDKKVSEADIQQILEAINLTASSAGIQPYRVIRVKNDDLRKTLGEGSFNTQIANSSDLLVFAAYENVDAKMITDYIERVAQVREVPVEALADFQKMLESYLLSRTAEQNFNWASRQAYIALGTGLIAAADLRIDATPMEGFDAEKFDTFLNLKEKGLKSVVLLSLGYRDAEQDGYGKLKKVRLPIAEFAMQVL